MDLWHSKDVVESFGTSFDSIAKYLHLARNTESPKQYHLWSLLSLTSALCSNNTWFNHGVAGEVKLNFGVVLIGRPALRKSSAISFMQRFASGLPLNYGPMDTGGARHGVMAAMQTRWQDDTKDSSNDSGNAVQIPSTLEELAASGLEHIISRIRRTRTRPSSIYFASKELGRLLTSQTRELLDFFADGLDGEPIFYQTKTGNIRIPTPLINLLGATTPGSLATILPRDAHDHGVLSRFIFVYGARNERSIPLPPAQTKQELEIQGQLLERLNRVSQEAEGEISFSPEAEREYRDLYDYNVVSRDFRLNAYSGRRAIHLVKLSSIICLLRAEEPYQVTFEDVALAHLILILTEVDMDSAYVAMSKSNDARAFALIKEIIESMKDDLPTHEMVMSQLIRMGWTEQESIQILDSLTRMHRIRSDHGKVKLYESMGSEKAGQYLDRVLKLKRRSRLTVV